MERSEVKRVDVGKYRICTREFCFSGIWAVSACGVILHLKKKKDGVTLLRVI